MAMEGEQGELRSNGRKRRMEEDDFSATGRKRRAISEKDRDSEKDKERVYKDKTRDSDKERERSHRHKDRERESEKNKDKERSSREKEKETDREKHKSHGDKSRDAEKHRTKEKERSHGKGRDRDQVDRDRDWDHSYHRSHDHRRSQDRDKELNDRDRSRSRERDHEHGSSKSKDRGSVSKHRDRDHGQVHSTHKDREHEKDLDYSQDLKEGQDYETYDSMSRDREMEPDHQPDHQKHIEVDRVKDAGLRALEKDKGSQGKHVDEEQRQFKESISKEELISKQDNTPERTSASQGQDDNANAPNRDGTPGQTPKESSLPMPDAVAKAKRALEIQKLLSEKMKKLPQVNKAVSQQSTTSSTVTAPSPTTTPKAASIPSATGVGAPSPANKPTNMINQVSTGVNFLPNILPTYSGAMPTMAQVPNYEALRKVQEITARFGIPQAPESLPFLNILQGQVPDDPRTAGHQKGVKGPVLRLDAQGREIDEHGNVIERTKISNLSTLKVNINMQKKESFQILHPELEDDPVNNPFFDPDMGVDKKKLLRPRRPSFQFVEEGRWTKQAEMMRLKSQFGDAQAKEIKLKQAALAKAKAELDINPNLIELSERLSVKEKPKDPIPDVEWWDAGLLVSGSYTDVTEGEMKVRVDKVTVYVEHPVPIEPPAEPAPPQPQPLKLTKKERKKLRTQRRLAKEQERQEMIRQGILEPPKPKIKMNNLMKVLGAEATQDPTKLEMEIRTAAAEREQAHTDRNLARKLTPAEQRKKKERKLFSDPNTLETIVSVYRVNDLTNPKLRFKVDVNAQENKLTGCAVLCDTMNVVVVEGGPKSIKRFSKLMLQRIKWAEDKKEEEGDEDGSQQVNRCVLVWQGSVAKPSFERFFVQQFRSEAAARKYLADSNVGHYWDLAANFIEE